jgi:hypothetical protein
MYLIPNYQVRNRLEFWVRIYTSWLNYANQPILLVPDSQPESQLTEQTETVTRDSM